MNTYVIGDIHGCFKTLKELYSKIPKNSTIYSVGDLLDKGPDSLKVIDFCIEKNIKPIRGNHEHLFLLSIEKYFNNNNISNSNWIQKWGGENTFNNYINKIDILKKHIKYISSLPLYYDIYINDKHFLISHGFALPYYDLRDNWEKSHRPFMSNRLFGSHYDVKDLSNIENLKNKNIINIFGHDAFKEVMVSDFYRGIDTGCVYGVTDKTQGCLTAICLEDLSIISQTNLDKVNYLD